MEYFLLPCFPVLFAPVTADLPLSLRNMNPFERFFSLWASLPSAHSANSPSYKNVLDETNCRAFVFFPLANFSCCLCKQVSLIEIRTSLQPPFMLYCPHERPLPINQTVLMGKLERDQIKSLPPLQQNNPPPPPPPRVNPHVCPP